jgi:hypothetical protein
MTDIISNDIMSVHGSDLTNDKIFIPQHSYRNLENISIIPIDFIRLNAAEKLQADMIISATGFIRRFPFFSEKHVQMSV